jgi:hypothetical protein
MREGFIGVDDGLVGRVAKNSGEVAFEEQTILLLGSVAGFLGRRRPGEWPISGITEVIVEN